MTCIILKCLCIFLNGETLYNIRTNSRYLKPRIYRHGSVHAISQEGAHKVGRNLVIYAKRGQPLVVPCILSVFTWCTPFKRYKAVYKIICILITHFLRYLRYLLITLKKQSCCHLNPIITQVILK